MAAPAVAAPGTVLDRFVYDARFAVAESFAAAAGRRGVPLAVFAGDLTELWYRDLDLAWRRRPETIGGATTAHGLFVLETLALDRRMRLVAREDRGLVNGERLFTWTIAPRVGQTLLS
jgi:hypothetical protein